MDNNEKIDEIKVVDKGVDMDDDLEMMALCCGALLLPLRH